MNEIGELVVTLANRRLEPAENDIVRSGFARNHGVVTRAPGHRAHEHACAERVAGRSHLRRIAELDAVGADAAREAGIVEDEKRLAGGVAGLAERSQRRLLAGPYEEAGEKLELERPFERRSIGRRVEEEAAAGRLRVDPGIVLGQPQASLR